MEDSVNQKTGNHDQHTEERLQRTFRQQIVHHEAGHEEENQRRDRVSPGPIGPRQFRIGDPELDDAEHSEEGAEQQLQLAIAPQVPKAPGWAGWSVWCCEISLLPTTTNQQTKSSVCLQYMCVCVCLSVYNNNNTTTIHLSLCTPGRAPG